MIRKSIKIFIGLEMNRQIMAITIHSIKILWHNIIIVVKHIRIPLKFELYIYIKTIDLLLYIIQQIRRFG